MTQRAMRRSQIDEKPPWVGPMTWMIWGSPHDLGTPKNKELLGTKVQTMEHFPGTLWVPFQWTKWMDMSYMYIYIYIHTHYIYISIVLGAPISQLMCFFLKLYHVISIKNPSPAPPSGLGSGLSNGAGVPAWSRWVDVVMPWLTPDVDVKDVELRGLTTD